MPKKSLNIDKFDGGLANYKNPRDIEDNTLVEANDIMVDVEGKIRLMGGSSYYTPPGTIAPLTDMLALVKPGYGLFAFGADSNISNEEKETKIIAVQSEGYVTLFDTEETSEAIELTNDYELGGDIEPSFFYINDALRISDGFFEESVVTGIPSHDDIKNVWYGRINRTFFGNDPGNEVFADLGWVQQPQEVNGSRTESDTEPPLINLNTNPTAGSGTIGCTIAFADDENGEWNAGEISNLSFGYSLLYDDDLGFGKQESPVRVYSSDGDTPTVMAVGGSVDRKMTITIKIHNSGSSLEGLGFPDRVTGFRIYWVGEGSAASLFDDPRLLAEGYFNKGVDNTGLVESHSNIEQVMAISGDFYTNSTALDVPLQPSLSYLLLNYYDHDVEYTSARYKCSVIANNICYIGNIRQGGRTYGDRIIKSPVGKFDIYPSTNFLEVAIGDGDAITALAEYSDRLLQFKRESVYVINISGDQEYIEDHQLHMGVDSQSAVTRISNGIAWVNPNGCYVYNGEIIEDIVSNRIDPDEWREFIGSKGMAGYLTRRKQIVVCGNPTNVSSIGDVYVYDLRTGSWTKGTDKLPPMGKSNFISTFHGDTLIASNTESTSESFDVTLSSAGSEPVDGEWHITNLGGASTTGTQLRLGGQNISQYFTYGPGSTMTFQEKVRSAIVQAPNELHEGALTVDWSGDTTPNTLVVRMQGHLVDDVTYNPAADITWSNAPVVITGSTEVYTPLSLSVAYSDLGGSEIAFQDQMGTMLATSISSQSDANGISLLNDTWPANQTTNNPSLIISGLTGTVNGVDLNELNREYKIGATTIGDYNSLGTSIGLSENKVVELLNIQPNVLETGVSSLSYADLAGQTATFTGISAIIYFLQEYGLKRIYLPTTSCHGKYSAGDVITTTYSNNDTGDNPFTDIFNGIEWTITHVYETNMQESLGGNQYIDSTLGSTSLSVVPNTPIPSTGQFTSNFSECIYTNLSIEKTSGATVPNPTTISQPSLGSNKTYTCIPRRGATVDGSVVYRLGIDAANRLTDEVSFSTNPFDNPNEVAQGLVDAITIENWVGQGMISSASQISVSGIAMTFNASANTIVGPGFASAGFTEDMEIEITGTSSNNGRFYISNLASGSPNDTLTINETIYTGLSSVVNESAVSATGKAGAFKVADVPISPGQSVLELNGYIYAKRVSVYEFDTSSDNASGLDLNIITKEISFDNLGINKNILGVYITHNPTEAVSVKCKDSSTGVFNELMPENIHDGTMRTYKYNAKIKNVKTIQLQIRSTASISNYELNDITIIYRDRNPR